MSPVLRFARRTLPHGTLDANESILILCCWMMELAISRWKLSTS